MTETLVRPDVLEESILEPDVLCMTTYRSGPPCGRPAAWRVMWRRFPCGHRPPPGLVCGAHRDALIRPPIKVACRSCRATWTSSEHLDRVEAL